MKTILLLAIALNLAMCTTLPTARVAYPVGDGGKAVVELDGKTVTATYSQRYR